MDYNDYCLDKYYKQEEMAEAALEQFERDIQGYLTLISESIESIKKIANSYENYDIDYKEYIRELL
jgi:hypothetical protein